MGLQSAHGCEAVLLETALEELVAARPAIDACAGFPPEALRAFVDECIEISAENDGWECPTCYPKHYASKTKPEHIKGCAFALLLKQAGEVTPQAAEGETT